MNARNAILPLVLFLASSLAAPERTEASGEASFMLGRSFVGALELEDKTSFGATIGAFSTFVGFELGVDYMPTSSFTVPGVDLGASVLNLTGNVVVQAPIQNFVPYGTVGYGALFANASGDFAGSDFLGTYGAFNYGLGLKLYFTDTVGLRIDYRRFAIQTDTDDPSLVIPIGNTRISSEPDIDRFLVGVTLRW